MSKIINRIFNFCFETKITVKCKILKYILIFICAVLFEMIALVTLYILSIFISPENYVFILTPVLSGLVIGYFYSQNRKWIKSINDTLLFSSAALKAIDEAGNIFSTSFDWLNAIHANIILMTVLSGSACLKAIISLIDAFYVDNNNKSALDIINKLSPAQTEEFIQILKNNLNDGK